MRLVMNFKQNTQVYNTKVYNDIITYIICHAFVIVTSEGSTESGITETQYECR